jgi:hypothetical protein
MAAPHTSHSLLERARPDRRGVPAQADRPVYPADPPQGPAYVAQAADASDVVQEVLAVLVRELPRFEHSNRPGAFRA